MHLNDQALWAIKLALQKSIMEQSDIVPVLRGFVFSETDDGLVVENPPILEIDMNQTHKKEDNADV